MNLYNELCWLIITCVYRMCTQGQQRKSALLEYFHATGKAKIKAVVYVSSCCCKCTLHVTHGTVKHRVVSVSVSV